MSLPGVVVQFRADADKARRDIDKLTRTIKGVGDQSQQSGKLMGGLSKAAKLGFAGVAAGAAVGATAVAGLLAKSVSLAANFEESQNILQSALGATTAEMKTLHQVALDMGKATVFSAQDASEAMVELAKAGQDVSQIVGGSVQAAMALAATEGIALADAAVYITNTMAQFSIKAKNAAKIADILAAGATASTASVQDLAQGLKYSGSTAKNVKVPFKNVVTALAALNSRGLDASTAGTSFNRFLLGLIPKSQLAAKTMAALRTEFQKADGELKSLPDIIAELSAELEGLPAPIKMKALKDMFGVEGARAAIGLMDLGVKGFRDLRKQVDETGRASEMADARTKGFKGALEKLGGAAETIGIQIGEKMLPVLTGWITQFTDWIDTPAGTAFFDSVAGQVETAVTSIKEWVDGTLAPAMQRMYDYFASPAGQEDIQSFAGAVEDMASAFVSLADSIDDVKAAWDKVSSFWQKIENMQNGRAPWDSGLETPEERSARLREREARTRGLVPEGRGSDPRGKRVSGGGTVNVTVINGKQEKSVESAAMALRLTRNLKGVA